MRYKPGHKEQTRNRILAAAGRGFRAQGFNGLGVDGLAGRAGVTSGAFYGHFRSKAEAFRAAVVAGLEQLQAGIGQLQEQEGKSWVRTFIAFYLGPRRTCALGETCALQNLSVEVERAGPGAQAAYQEALLLVADRAAAALPGQTPEKKEEKAWALLALLSGGVSLARAVKDKDLGDRIASAVQMAAEQLVGA